MVQADDNFAATFPKATATGVAAGKPFTALQIVRVSITMDGPPAMTLGVDPPAEDTVRRRPGPVTKRILMRVGAVHVAQGSSARSIYTTHQEDHHVIR